MAIFWFLKMVVLEKMKYLSQKTSTDIDDTIIGAIKGIKMWVYAVVSIFISAQILNVQGWVDKVVTTLFLFVIVWQVIEIVLCFIDYFTNRFLKGDGDTKKIDPSITSASNMVTVLARIVLWSLGFLFVLSNLGIEITSLIAGLGIGGIAVAFAIQGILSDLFASFSIHLDKPFRIGDFIVIGDDSGVVEKIGIKSTRIRTLQGQELVVSNMELTTARVQNFKKMQERRIVVQIGVTYEISQDNLLKINDIVKDIFGHLDGGRLDRVHFTTFGDFSLIFEVVYYVESADYADYLNIQQQFNFELREKFLENGINFAYPTQTVFMKPNTD